MKRFSCGLFLHGLTILIGALLFTTVLKPSSAVAQDDQPTGVGDPGFLVIILHDAEGWGQPGSLGRVVLYNGLAEVGQAQANSGSTVMFLNLSPGSGYSYRVYVNKPSPWGEQFWGEKTGISISSNNTTYDTFVRNAPYMPAINVYNDVTGEDIFQKTVPFGTRIRIQLTIKNPSNAGAMTTSTYAGLILDRGKTPPYDHNSQTSSESFAVGTTKQIITYITPGTSGGYYHSGALFSSSNRYSTSLTDAGSWGGAALFTVSADNTPPPAPNGLVSTPGTWTNVNTFGINWTNPPEASGIAAAWYKLGTTPVSNTDGVRQTTKPFTVTASIEGGQTLHLWLEDGSGNKDQNNRSTTTLYFDGTAPAGGTININSGAPTTSSSIVTLNGLGAADGGGSGVYQMRFSNDSITWSVWETYTTVRSAWDLTQFGGNSVLGRKKVYAQYRDGAGNLSSVVVDDILYGTQSPWQFVNTGVSHTIIIPLSANPNITGTPLSAGDFVGVFYDSSGTLACAGYERWTGSSNITVSAFGDDATTGAKDGLVTGEVFRWKVFRESESKTYEAEVTYTPLGGVVTSTDSYVTNGISQLTSLVGGITTHSLSLRSGWGLISGYVAPQNTALDAILQPVLTDVIIVKNGAQKAYIPSVPVNSIGPWVTTEGYQIKMRSPRTLSLRGQKIVPWSLTIGLPQGWSILPYVRDADMTIAAALGGVVGDIVIVKDQDGKTFIPSVGINGIGTMKVGHAYQIKMTTGRTIEYPATSRATPHGDSPESRKAAHTETTGPPWFFSNTGVSHTIVIPSSVNPSVNGIPLAEGDHIGVFYDSSGTLACAGYEAWNGTTPVAVTAFGDDGTTSEKDGLASGEVLRWKIWRRSNNDVFTGIATYLAPGGIGGIVTDTSRYSTNGISAMATLTGSLTSVSLNEMPPGYMLLQNFPNPFNPSTVIRYGLPQRTRVRLTVYNALGEQVAELVDGEREAGYHEVQFNATGLSSGIYVYRIQGGEFALTRKLLLVK